MIDALTQNLPKIIRGHEAVRVATTTLLPSGALATVTVCPHSNGAFFVSDDGAAWHDLLALGHGELTSGDTKRGNKIADRLGLVFDGRGFSIREATADQLPGAIVFVAEAAREWASLAMESGVRRTEATIARQAEELIRSVLPKAKILRDVEVAGASTKRHRFDLVLDLSRDRKAVFEIVAPNPNSLSAAHLKLFDLKEAHADWPREAVTERLRDWTSSDMNLLARVATHVRAIDQDWGDLSRLIH